MLRRSDPGCFSKAGKKVELAQKKTHDLRSGKVPIRRIRRIRAIRAIRAIRTSYGDFITPQDERVVTDRFFDAGGPPGSAVGLTALHSHLEGLARVNAGQSCGCFLEPSR